MVLLTDNYFEHHGVLGQKWGVRRYQNKDGSLTRLGRKRQQAQSVGFSETSPAVDHGTYLEYPKGSVLGRCGMNDYDLNRSVYLYTNNADRKEYLKIFSENNQRVFITTKPIKRPEVVEQFKILDAFMKANADRYPWIEDSVWDDPYEFWRDHIDQCSQLSDDYFNHLKSKGYSAVLDYKDYCTKNVEDPIIVFDRSALGFDNPTKIKHHDTRITEMQLLTNDYLEHHGVPGQKWGVRRYQNKDGSLTAAGRKRLSTGSGNSLAGAVERYKAKRAAKANIKAKLAKQKQAEEAGHEDFRKARAKKPKQMSTSELKEATDRLKLESQYAELAKKLHKETPKEYLKRVAITTAKAQGEQVAAYMMGKAINKMFGAEVIKGLATKQNVDAGKKMAEEIKNEVPTAPGAFDKAKAKIKEQYKKAADRDAERIKKMSQKVKDERNAEASKVHSYSDFETSFYDRSNYPGAPRYKIRTDKKRR